jgi:hypothetical protein
MNRIANELLMRAAPRALLPGCAQPWRSFVFRFSPSSTSVPHADAGSARAAQAG